MMTKEELPRPSQSEMKRWLDEWQKLADYKAQEEALDRIFKKDDSLRLNKSFEAVLLKCAVLNDFYSTNIYKVYLVAKWILKRCGDVDARLVAGDPSLVDDIAKIGGETFYLPDRDKPYTMSRVYSFATKFCSHHNEKDFPIYDFYVHRLLHYFNAKEEFTKIGTHLHLRKSDMIENHHYVPLCEKYENFVRAMKDFECHYGLKPERGFKDIDRYLWQAGKNLFPKRYGRKQDN